VIGSPGRAHSRPAQPWSAADVAALSGATLLAGVLRMWRLDVPQTLMFDEIFYAKDACWYALSSEAVCKIGYEQTAVHPPLGKWLLAAGIRVFGYDAFGWRVAAAVAGTVTVALLFVLGRKLLGSTLGAVTAAVALAIDPLHFVQSRVAMLRASGRGRWSSPRWSSSRLCGRSRSGAGTARAIR
jgi:dolichyl-phosphate-mannose-protein mannosyltransferase